jgi:hypothetical protein
MNAEVIQGNNCMVIWGSFEGDLANHSYERQEGGGRICPEHVEVEMSKHGPFSSS